MQDGIQIPLEQQLQSMSWILNSNTTNIVTEEHNSIPQRLVKTLTERHFFLPIWNQILKPNLCLYSKGKSSALRVLHSGAIQATLEQGNHLKLQFRVKKQAFLMN